MTRSDMFIGSGVPATNPTSPGGRTFAAVGSMGLATTLLTGDRSAASAGGLRVATSWARDPASSAGAPAVP